MRFALHPLPALHPVFETLGYAIGFAIYRRARSRVADPLEDHQRWNILAAAAVGALLGSRILGILDPDGERLIPFDTYNLFYRDTLEQTRLAPLRGRALFSG